MSLASSGKGVMLTLLWTASLRQQTLLYSWKLLNILTVTLKLKHLHCRKQTYHLKWSSREELHKHHYYLHKDVFAMPFCELLTCPYPCITGAFNNVVKHFQNWPRLRCHQPPPLVFLAPPSRARRLRGDIAIAPKFLQLNLLRYDRQLRLWGDHGQVSIFS